MYKLKLLTLSLVSVIFFAGCTSVQTAPGKTQLAKADKNKSDMVCFKQVRVGSHFKKKVCMSKKDAAEAKRSAQAALREIQVNSATLPNKG